LRRSVATLLAGDEHVTATVLSDGAALVARLQPARSAESSRTVQVSVVVRGVRLDALEIGKVEDLQPFWDRRGPWLTRLAAAHEAAAAEVTALGVPSGLDALRALVDSSIRQADHLRQEQDGAPSLGSSRRDRILWRRLWDAATEVQGHLSGQPLDVASRAVTSMVNHLTTASLQLSWFADPGLRVRAINETIGYVVFDAVASTGVGGRACPIDAQTAAAPADATVPIGQRGVALRRRPPYAGGCARRAAVRDAPLHSSAHRRASQAPRRRQWGTSAGRPAGRPVPKGHLAGRLGG